MPTNINNLVITGRLTRDAEDRKFNGGGGVIGFGIGFLESSYKGQDGKMVYKNGFVDVKKFYGEKQGKMADWLMEAAVKGAHVAIVGKLGFEEWEDSKSGSKRNKLTVVAENIQFMNAPSGSDSSRDSQKGNDRGGSRSGGNRSGGERRSNNGYETPDPDADGDGWGKEEIPF